MNFGEAIEAARAGKRISRSGWNGKGMWVCLMPGTTIPEELVNGRTKKFVPTGDLVVGAYFVIWTAQSTWQPGWRPTQIDVLADDWCALPDHEEA